MQYKNKIEFLEIIIRCEMKNILDEINRKLDIVGEKIVNLKLQEQRLFKMKYEENREL